jgi:tRNA threonylcarbamoyladenosine biosynthesis protein TsaB
VQPRFLIVETSHHVGKVALAQGEALVAERLLDESRRHARDLAPAAQRLLTQQGWRARDLDAVIVSRGPGSYTGLRVGLMSAKTLAYATGCALLAIETFQAIYQQVLAGSHAGAWEPGGALDVIADAQQDNIYAQRFGTFAEPLTIVPYEMWLESALALHVAVTGPGLESFADRLPPALTMLPRETWLSQPTSLLKIGRARFLNGERDDPFVVEPLYLRASSAEEKWHKLHPRR